MESDCRFASTKSKTAEHFKTKSQVVRPVILQRLRNYFYASSFKKSISLIDNPVTSAISEISKPAFFKFLATLVKIYPLSRTFFLF